MKQQSFSDAEYVGKKKQTLRLRSGQARREVFLAEMDCVVPWSKLEALIAPHYPKAGKAVGPIRCRRCCASTAGSNGTG